MASANFSNLLTVGPTEYNGGVATIDVDEVHPRGSTSHIKELLQELSGEPDCPIGRHAPRSGHDVCEMGPRGRPTPPSRRQQHRPADLCGGAAPPGQETGRTTTASDANAKLASRSPADLNYRSRQDQYEASGRSALYRDKTGDYRAQSYVTLQINALDDTGPIAPPRVWSVTQEKAIRTRASAKRTGADQ